MSLWNIQVALKNRLENDETLMSKITGVLDEIDSGQQFPYIRLGEDTLTDDGTKTFNIDNVTHTLHVFSQYKGKKEAKETLSLIREALNDPLPIGNGFSLWSLQIEMMEVFEEDEGKTKHGVMRIRFKIRSDN
ncbi:hypothetical protein BTR23_07455 [Alkalihalophilus pseudofirmus]|nr:hypothetical protein BTR23_07455 [Alkalihalophilus pseudofirmus]